MNFTLSNLIYNNRSTLPDSSGLNQLDYVIVWTEIVCYVKSIVMHNTSNSIETVNIYNVPRMLIGSAATFGWLRNSGASNNRIYSFNLDPLETKSLEFKQPLILANDYDSIQAYSTTADVVTIQIYGAKE